MKLFFIIFCFALSPVLIIQAISTEERVGNPFLLPQTSFSIARGEYNRTIQRQKITLGGDPGINQYGLAIEVNSSPITNIGMFMQYENLSNKNKATQNANGFVAYRFTNIIGGFVRFFYAPEILSHGLLRPSFFTRMDLGAGPTLSMFSGMVVHGGVAVGVENYFSKWIGFSISYGFSYDTGREQIKVDEKRKSYTFTDTGKVISFSFKTTYF